ncbi:alpha/beta hydrolase [Gluconobacter japonicus]|uniref:alpha/beta hydrolase n=1 Tax=Gluconobacter japonicus TaxID=376620 RepID=UPI000A9943B0|nr:alpha/beta fold hydrolase [Gluconobacter japonicus]
MRTIIVSLSVPTLMGVLGCWIVGSIMTKGSKSYVAAARPPSQDIQLETRDGVSLAATFTPGKKRGSPAVLLLHGVGASRQKTALNAAWLASLGYATLTIDFRGHGQSDIKSRTFGLTEALDVETAFTWLKAQQENAPVCIIGISLGGAACLIGNAGPIPAEALILQAVYSDIRHAIRNRLAKRGSFIFGYLFEPFLSFQAPLRLGVRPSRLSPLKVLPQYRGALLVIGGEQDQSTLPAETRALFAVARGDKSLLMLTTGDHATLCDLTSQTYRDNVEAFLARTIGVANV